MSKHFKHSHLKIFLFLYLWRTWVLLVGPLILLFRTSGDVSSGFQIWAALFVLSGGVSGVCFLKFTSGATPACLLVAESFWSTYLLVYFTSRPLGSQHGSPGCARFPEFMQNFSECQNLWSLCSVDFYTLTLQLPIQTPHSVAPELQVFMSSL